VAALLRERQEQAARGVALVVIVAAAVGGIFAGFVALEINRALGLALLPVVAGVGLWNGILLVLLRRGLFRPWMDWVNGTLEVSAVSAVVLVDAVFQGPEYAFTSAPPYLYAGAIVMSAVRMRRTLALYTGALAAVQFYAIYLLQRAAIEPALLEALPSLQAWNVAQRSIYFLVAGLLAFTICALYRRNMEDLLTSTRAKREAERTLGRHVSHEVAEVLLAARGADLAEGRTVTVLFADLRGFTTYAEGRDPREVQRLLNGWFDVVSDAVEAHGGIVNKFIGDGVMALFGAPEPHEDHAAQAVSAALEIVAQAPARLGGGAGGPLGVGVGVHTGHAVVGTIGSRSRAEYTAVGDAVNLASRLEQLTKDHGVPILVSEATRAAVGDRLPFRPVGELAVRGRTTPVTAHEPLPAAAAATG
jgi:adenylate cyclase